MRKVIQRSSKIRIDLRESLPRPTCLFYGTCLTTGIAKKGKIYVCTVDDYKTCPLNPAACN